MRKYVLVLSLLFSLLCNAQLVKTTLTKNSGRDGESFRSATFNGVWHWFADPRAVYYEGKYKRTYIGWVDNYGDVTIGYYDHATGQFDSHVVYDKGDVTDHDNPTLLFDEEGRLTLFFNNQVAGNVPIIELKAKNPEDIMHWNAPNVLLLNKAKENTAVVKGDSHYLVHPIKLSGENGRVYLFWHAPGFMPSYSTSDDNGNTWSAGKNYFEPELINGKGNAFNKVYSNGKNKIHFVVTDGSPRKQYNAIYYYYYQNGAFYKANGQPIANINELPIKAHRADLVYDATTSKEDAFTWDVAEDATGSPVVVYVKFRNDSTHCLTYARWDGKRWNNHELINAGGWFPKTQKGKIETEPFYSGGIIIDKEDANTLYLSVKRDSVFEIEKWVTKDNGISWKVEFITHGSKKDNVRPFAVRGAKEGNPLQILWMQNSRYIRFNAAPVAWEDRYQVAIKTNLSSPSVTNPLDTNSIKALMHRVADWQIANPTKNNPRNWEYATFYIGLMDLYQATGENRYLNEIFNLAQHENWKPMNDIFHADRIAIADLYLKLYEIYKDPIMIDKSRFALDIIMSRGTGDKIAANFVNNPNKHESITWCDALFMSPPVFARMAKVTGDDSYLKYMDVIWQKAFDHLYSKEDSLIYRDDRFLNKLSNNGKKIFWGRGNGWVIAGLARILEVLPNESPLRPQYEKQYKEMATKLLRLQTKEGMYTTSLLDAKFMPQGESSASALICYALAYGVNHGLIDQKYRSNVQKTWIALSQNVNANGRLGNVQQVGYQPETFKADDWHLYASGAYLMVGKQMMKLMK